jgi:cytochrome P450
MFAMRETLAINTARALALIVSHPEKERRVRDELVWSDHLTPQAVQRLKYVEGCIQEAMRLWPTTPFIAREVVTQDVLNGETVSPGMQVLILNTFNHRDRESSPDADAFCPEQWLEGPPDLPFNHLSSGTQVCAGKDLALFISKSVLATLLHKGKYALERPHLNPRKPVPSMYNHFRLVFRRK